MSFGEVWLPFIWCTSQRNYGKPVNMDQYGSIFGKDTNQWPHYGYLNMKIECFVEMKYRAPNSSISPSIRNIIPMLPKKRKDKKHFCLYHELFYLDD